MKENLCPIINLKDIPEKIFGLVSKDINWFELVKLYNSQSINTNYLVTKPIMKKLCKETKCKKMKKFSELENINLKHLLQFLGSYRKIIISSIASRTIKTIDKEYYKEIFDMKNISIANFIVVNDKGSENITSDYDISFTGPGVYKIVSCMKKKFNNYVKNNIYNDNKKNTLTSVFDSNLYLTPDLIVNDKVLHRLKNIGVTEYFDLKHIFPDAVKSYSLKRIIPIPTNNIIDLELDVLKNKINYIFVEPLETHKIENKYNNMVLKSKLLDTFLYASESDKERKKIKKHLKDQKDFFKLLTNIKQNELESYHCFSTVLIIVFGIIDNKLKTSNLYEKLTTDNFLVCVIENLIDLVKHHSHDFENISKDLNVNKSNIQNIKAIAVKYSKYFQRLYLSLYYYFKKNGKKFPFSKDLNLINKVVENRKLPSYKWGKEVKDYIKKYSLLNTLKFNIKWIKSIENSLMVNDKDKFKSVFIDTNKYHNKSKKTKKKKTRKNSGKKPVKNKKKSVKNKKKSVNNKKIKKVE